MNLKIPLKFTFWIPIDILFSVKVTHKCNDFWSWGVLAVSTFLDELLTQSRGNGANWSSLDNATFIILLKVNRLPPHVLPIHLTWLMVVDVLKFFFLLRLRAQ